MDYLSMPYASVTENLKPADPPPKFEGIRDATRFADRCMQFDKNANVVIGTENCLFLNIHRLMEMEKVLPAMVYIHGGAFMFGILFNLADFVD